MNGVSTREKTMSGPAVHIETDSGNSSASDLGASSPSTMCRIVMNVNAMTVATTCVATALNGGGRPSNSVMTMAAMVDSPTQPSASDASVMPSCVPEM